MLCPNCGKSLPDSAKFCTGCGTPLTAPSAPAYAPQDQGYPAQAPAYPEQAPVYAEQPPVYAEQPPVYTEQPPVYAEQPPVYAEQPPVYAAPAPEPAPEEAPPPPAQEVEAVPEKTRNPLVPILAIVAVLSIAAIILILILDGGKSFRKDGGEDEEKVSASDRAETTTEPAPPTTQTPAEPSSEEPTAPPATEPPVTSTAVQAGSVSGGVYSNEYLNLCATAPSGWKIGTAEDLANLNELTLEAYQGTDIADLLQRNGQCFDLLMTDDFTGNNINLLYQQMPAGFAALSDETYFNLAESTYRQQLAAGGFEVKGYEVETRTFCGEEKTVLKLTTSISGFTMEQYQLMVRTDGDYFGIMTLSIFNGAEPQQFLDHFDKLHH